MFHVILIAFPPPDPTGFSFRQVESPEVIPGRRLGCPSFQVVVVSSGNACATPLAGPASYPTSVYNL